MPANNVGKCAWTALSVQLLLLGINQIGAKNFVFLVDSNLILHSILVVTARHLPRSRSGTQHVG